MPYACEVKLLTMRELTRVRRCDTPARAVRFFRDHVQSAPWFSPEKECAVALLLNTRSHIIGFELLGIGTKSSVLVHVGEAFRAAIVANAAALVLAHNHPSGDPSPSSADYRVTRTLADAARLLQITLLDHIILGSADGGRVPYFSFREAGSL